MFKGFLLTFVIFGLVIKFFLNGLLGIFGFTAIPVQMLSQLNHSKQIVDKMKTRHKGKKYNASKRFVKKSGKKVAATAVSAATIGTVAVIGTLTYLEISQYCDEQRELMIDENLLYDTSSTFDLSACLVEAKKDSTAIADEAWLSIKQSSDDFFEPSRQAMVELFESIDQWYNH